MTIYAIKVGTLYSDSFVTAYVLTLASYNIPDQEGII